jgi:hypothetical protein
MSGIERAESKLRSVRDSLWLAAAEFASLNARPGGAGNAPVRFALSGAVTIARHIPIAFSRSLSYISGNPAILMI